MHGGECVGDLGPDVDHLRDVESADAPVRTGVELHHDARVTVGRERRREHRDDAGVGRQLTHHATLAFERPPLPLVFEGGVQHLDGDRAFEPVLVRAKHPAETAAAEKTEMEEKVVEAGMMNSAEAKAAPVEALRVLAQ